MTTKQLAKQERDKTLWKAGKLCSKLTHRYGFWLDLLISISLKVERKNPIFSIPIRLVKVLPCEKHCWLLWLARTFLRTKIYDKTFKSAYLSMYKTNTETILQVLLA